jgi:hypothetical protein
LYYSLVLKQTIKPN